MTQLRRGVVGVIAAFVVISLSFSAQAAEKKKITGTNKQGPLISHTVVSPGDDPKHELTLTIRRDTTTSSDPDHNETEVMQYEQSDSVAGTGTHRGYFRLHLESSVLADEFEFGFMESVEAQFEEVLVTEAEGAGE